MEETKKMKCYKRLIYKQFCQVFVAHSFWAIWRNFSRTFVELCMETPYWCTVSVHQYIWPPEINKNIWSLLFLWKLFLFTRELAYVRINVSSNTWSGYIAESQEERLFFPTRQHSYFGVTHCENSEVQIAVFSKWNMLRKWKLVQRFTFCLSST